MKRTSMTNVIVCVLLGFLACSLPSATFLSKTGVSYVEAPVYRATLSLAGNSTQVSPATVTWPTNSWAIGAAFNYTGGYSDFNFYFDVNAFLGWPPEEIVLTVSAPTELCARIGVVIGGSPPSVQLVDEAWYLSTNPPSSAFRNQYLVESILNSWSTIELKIFNYGGFNYVGYYLNGNWYDSWGCGGTTFDTEMAPNVVIESAASSLGVATYGYLRNGNTNLATQFYGAQWAHADAGYTASCQTTSFYVGGSSNVQAPNNVGVMGNIICSLPAYEIGLGNTANFEISDQIVQAEYSQDAANCWQLRVS